MILNYLSKPKVESLAYIAKSDYNNSIDIKEKLWLLYPQFLFF